MKYVVAFAAGGIYMMPLMVVLCAVLLITRGVGLFAEITTYAMFPLIIGSLIYGFRSYLKWEREHSDGD